MMPKIAELKEIDGAIWARMDIDLATSEQGIGLYDPSEINHLHDLAIEDAAREIESAGGDSAEFHARQVRELKHSVHDQNQEISVERIRRAMQDAWDDFTSDTNCYPDCFKITRGPKLWADFKLSNFAEMVAMYLNAQPST